MLIARNRAMFINKNGLFYSLGQGGTFQFSSPLGAGDGSGMFSTPATDGQTVVVGAGYTVSPSAQAKMCRITLRRDAATPFAAAPGQARIVALDYFGNRRWTMTTSNPLYGSVAITNGLAFAAVDNKLYALDINTGAVLWSFTAPSLFRASPVVVPSGVYAVDVTGDLYAFGLPH